jgi:hypothetical protein
VTWNLTYSTPNALDNWVTRTSVNDTKRSSRGAGVGNGTREERRVGGLQVGPSEDLSLHSTTDYCLLTRTPLDQDTKDSE